MKGEHMILDSIFSEQHVPSVYYNEFFFRYSGASHIFTQLGNTPEAFQLTDCPIQINQLISNFIDILIQLIENAFLNVLNGGVDIAVFFIKFKSDWIGVKFSIVIGEL